MVPNICVAVNVREERNRMDLEIKLLFFRCLCRFSFTFSNLSWCQKK